MLQQTIENIWDNRELLQNEDSQKAIREVIRQLDLGELRVAEPTDNGWKVNEWVKKAVLMYFQVVEIWHILLLSFTTVSGYEAVEIFNQRSFSGTANCEITNSDCMNVEFFLFKKMPVVQPVSYGRDETINPGKRQ